MRSRRADTQSVNLPAISTIRNPLTDELAHFLDLTDPDSYKRQTLLEAPIPGLIFGSRLIRRSLKNQPVPTPVPLPKTPTGDVCTAHENILARMTAVINSPYTITVRALLEVQRDAMKKTLTQYENIRLKLEKRFIEIELELRQHPKKKDPIRVAREKEFEKKSQDLAAAGAKLMAIEREFYDKYLNATRIMTEGSNPCRDFKL